MIALVSLNIRADKQKTNKIIFSEKLDLIVQYKS
jgi:hypothetical protein